MEFKGSPYDPISARINTALSTPVTLVAGAAGQSVRVYGLRITSAGAAVVQIRSNTTVLEQINFAGNGGGIILDLRSLPYYVTGSGESLIILSSAAIQLDGVVEYAIGK